MKERGAIGLNELLCRKVPSELEQDAGRTFREKLEDDIREREAMGLKPFAFEKLAEIIAGRLASKKSGMSGTAVITKSGKEKCHNCDSKECEGIGKCKIVCKSVNWLKGCPCCRGERCIIAQETLPEREQLKGTETKIARRKKAPVSRGSLAAPLPFP